MDEDSSRNRKHDRSTVLGKEMFSGYIGMSPERVSVGEEGEERERELELELENFIFQGL